jgi:hypothetical protein
MAWQLFISSADKDQFFFKQLLNGIIRAYTPNGFDLSLGNRLLISNNGQGFQGSS